MTDDLPHSPEEQNTATADYYVLPNDEFQRLWENINDPVSDEEKEQIVRDLEVKREDTRSKLAERLMWLVFGTYGLIFFIMTLVIWVPSGDDKSKADRYAFSKDIFTLLITTQVGIFGAVIGFYFGSNTKGKT